MRNQKTLIAVVGPTAVGKTSLAIGLAKKYETEIISADSRQFYRELNIGTAKPTADELAQVKHHFIDSHSIEEEYSAGDFERAGLAKLNELFLKHDKVVAVGGSGLFVRALCEGLDDLPKAPVAVRAALNEALEKQGLAYLQQELKKIDPVYYQQADLGNPQRVIRALEVFQASGNPISYYLTNQAGKKNRNFQIITIGLNMPRESLYNRINQRVELMIQQGLLKEVQELIPFQEKPALLTVGYAELFQYLAGEITLQRAIELIKQNSRRYAKRQITWFKKYGNTHWFEPTQMQEIIAYIDQQGTLVG